MAWSLAPPAPSVRRLLAREGEEPQHLRARVVRVLGAGERRAQDRQAEELHVRRALVVRLVAVEQELQRQGMLDGFIRMRDYGWRKVIEGQTTIEEVVSSTEIG